MSSLRLKRDHDEFYVVYDEIDTYVGRIFKRLSRSSKQHQQALVLGLEFHAARGVRAFYGHAAAKEHAMAEFKTVWNTRPDS